MLNTSFYIPISSRLLLEIIQSFHEILIINILIGLLYFMFTRKEKGSKLTFLRLISSNTFSYLAAYSLLTILIWITDNMILVRREFYIFGLQLIILLVFAFTVYYFNKRLNIKRAALMTLFFVVITYIYLTSKYDHLTPEFINIANAQIPPVQPPNAGVALRVTEPTLMQKLSRFEVPVISSVIFFVSLLSNLFITKDIERDK